MRKCEECDGELKKITETRPRFQLNYTVMSQKLERDSYPRLHFYECETCGTIYQSCSMGEIDEGELKIYSGKLSKGELISIAPNVTDDFFLIHEEENACARVNTSKKHSLARNEENFN